MCLWEEIIVAYRVPCNGIANMTESKLLTHFEVDNGRAYMAQLAADKSFLTKLLARGQIKGTF